MYDHTQTTKEVASAIFYALLSLYDDAAERESTQLLRDAVATGAVKDPIARSILTSIVRNPERWSRRDRGRADQAHDPAAPAYSHRAT